MERRLDSTCMEATRLGPGSCAIGGGRGGARVAGITGAGGVRLDDGELRETGEAARETASA